MQLTHTLSLSGSARRSGRTAPWGNSAPLSGLAATLAVLGLAAAPAHAQLSIKIDHPSQVIYQGQTVLFTGTLTNTSATDTIEITGAGVGDLFNGNYSNPSFIGGNSYFTSFANVNATVVQYAPGQSYTGDLFYLTSAGAPPGTYTWSGGAFSLQGQDLTSGGGYYVNSPTGFSVDVLGGPAPAPEPSSMAAFAFMGLGTLGLLLKARKRRANAA